jgi:CheY-like chemotaxis protein
MSLASPQPFARLAGESDLANATLQQPQDRGEAVTKRALVLVVEDEPDVRELIADVLAENGYEIEVAPDGAAALQLSDQRQYDLILSDLRMPKMDGAALYWALQLRHGTAMPPMIYVTGQANSLDYAGFLAASRVPVLSKPFSPEDLRQAVRQALASSS